MQRAEAAAIRARERLPRYREAVLRAAVTGELTRDWREAQRKNKEADIKTGEALLQRLLAIRRQRWEEVGLQRLRAAGKERIAGEWKSRYPEPHLPDTEDVPNLPQGWTWASLDQLLSALRNGVSEAPRETDGLPILRISAVRALRVELSDCRYLPASTTEKYRDYALQEGDLLFTRYNGSRKLAGACGRVPPIIETVVFPDKLIRGVPVQGDEPLPSFIAMAANSGASRQYIEPHLFTTAGQWGISGRNLKVTPLPLPSKVEQVLIVREADRRLAAADRLTATLDRQLDRARHTRQSLLREAFAGRLIPQDSRDEPASVLLERIRATWEAEAQTPKATPMSRYRSEMKAAERRDLFVVLKEKGEPMTPEELFRASGHSQESVDQFFAELRELTSTPTKIEEQRRRGGQILLKALQ